MKGLFFYFVFSCLSVLPGFSQEGKVTFEHLSAEQGLSHNFTMTVMQDRKGFLWFGTGNGLDKYDGYRFTNYKFNPRDSTSLAKNQVLPFFKIKMGLFGWEPVKLSASLTRVRNPLPV